MLRVATRDGLELRARTPRGLLREMRRAAWFPGSDLNAYIRKTKVRAGRQTGGDFRAKTSGELVAKLIKAGLLVDMNGD